MAAAFETLSDLIGPGMSSRTISSQSSRVRWRSPLPSAPSTRARGPDVGARPERRRGLGIEAEHLEAAPLERLDGVAEIADLDQRHQIERAGRRLGHHPGLAGRVARGGDHRVGPEGAGGAQDRADIVRVGDLVEDDHQVERR